jgi:23S rRNA pseudouridine2605 synthase
MVKDCRRDAVRLQKFLASAGLCSRRKAEEMIVRGEVAVDGLPAVLGMKVHPGEQIVTVAGQEIRHRKRSTPTVLALHKPRGYECTHFSPHCSAESTIYTLLPLYDNHRLICCGRLDRDSEGLVLLTDDGDLAARILHPSNGVEKFYRVLVDIPLRERDRKDLLAGIVDGDDRLTMKGIKVLSGDRRLLDVRLGSGKKRHIRRMLASLGYSVTRLVRYRIGNFSLEGIPVGRYFQLQERHINKLFCA